MRVRCLKGYFSLHALPYLSQARIKDDMHLTCTSFLIHQHVFQYVGGMCDMVGSSSPLSILSGQKRRGGKSSSRNESTVSTDDAAGTV